MPGTGASRNWRRKVRSFFKQSLNFNYLQTFIYGLAVAESSGIVRMNIELSDTSDPLAAMEEAVKNGNLT